MEKLFAVRDLEMRRINFCDRIQQMYEAGLNFTTDLFLFASPNTIIFCENELHEKRDVWKSPKITTAIKFPAIHPVEN